MRFLLLGCGLLVAYGCGRTHASDPDDTGGSSNDTGGAQTHGGSLPSGGASATGGAARQGGSPSAPTSGTATGGVATGGAAATGGNAGAAGGDVDGGAGDAGSPGAGGDSGVCAVNVPATSGMGALQAAIDAAPVPSTVCLQGGGYRGDLTLRAGVSLRGTGFSSVICGTVNGDAATRRMTTLSDLQIEGLLEATGNVRLSLHNLEINTGHTAICVTSSLGVRIAQPIGGALDLTIDGVTLGSPGIEIAVTPGVERIDDSIVIRNSRCNSTSQCYDFLRFSFDTQPAAQAGSGSRLLLDVFNNVVRNIVLEGVVFDVQGGLSAEDAAKSRLWFRHNTLASAGDLNSAIAFATPPSLPVVLANNAIAYIATPVLHGDVPAVTQVGNLTSTDESSTSWFADFALGDFSPSVNSPLIGGGSSAYGVPTDINGTTRIGGFDSGAYQH